jgi:hypothetical protein
MRTYIRALFLLASMLVGGAASAQSTCTQTLSPGANLASAVAGAATGSTICLNSGNYGTVDLFNISRSGFVTVQSTSGTSAQIGLRVGNSGYIRFSNLTIPGLLHNSCSKNIEYRNSTFTDYATLTNYGCGNISTLFDGNTFSAFNKVSGTYDGRLSLIYGSGITITNNTFGPGGQNDGIFMGGNVSDVAIGPGNRFTGILESVCNTHCDAIQGYGAGSGIVIQGNLFENGDTYIMMPDGSDGVTVRNNVFNGASVSYLDKVQFGAAASPVFQHNTLINIRASFDSKGSPATTNALVENNIMAGGSSFKTVGGDGCSACTFRRNMYNASGNAIGTNNLTGSPTFVGGASPSTRTGFQLASSSAGYLAGTDGLDLGAGFSGTQSAAAPALQAPTNLSVQ